MNNMEKALWELEGMDDLAAGDSPLHRLHPAAKLLAAVIYIVTVTSFDKYDLSGLMPMVLFPALLFQIGGIPVRACFRKLRVVLPLVMAVGLFDPLFDRAPGQKGIPFSAWGSFLGQLLLRRGHVRCRTLISEGDDCRDRPPVEEKEEKQPVVE